MGDDKKTTLDRHILLGFLTFILVCVAIAAFLNHDARARLYSDFWPIDRSYIAPNIVAAIVQYVVLAVVLSLFYPPFRKAVERFVTRHKDELKDHISSELSDVHAKIDHVIRHSKDIPAFKQSPPTEREPNGRFKKKGDA